jgi:hypothetical protein
MVSSLAALVIRECQQREGSLVDVVNPKCNLSTGSVVRAAGRHSRADGATHALIEIASQSVDLSLRMG